MARVEMALLTEIIRDWEQAPHGAKGRVLAEHLPTLGLSVGAFHRLRQRLGWRPRRRARADRGRTAHPERGEWTRLVMRLKYSDLKDVHALPTWRAVDLAVQWGLVPPEAREVHESEYNRLAREMALVPTPRRGRRFEAPHANFLHQVDASGSLYLYPHRCVQGEWRLRLRSRPMKNKEKMERQRLWYWGLVDDFSGCRVIRAVVAPGEAAKDGIRFLRWAWGREEEHAPLSGQPRVLYLDNGVLAKTKPFRQFAAELGVEVKTHEPYRPQATGKVETGWKDLWRSLETAYLRLPDWRQRELTLSELNRELCRLVQELNRRPHRRLPCSKLEAWLGHNPGVGSVAPEAWARIFREEERVLDDAGCFDYQGRPYQVKEIWARKVVVKEGVLDGGLWVMDPKDGKHYAVTPFEPPVAGEYRAAAATPLEELLQEPLPEGLPLPQFPARESNVVPLVRRGEVRDAGPALPETAPEEPPLNLADLARGVGVLPPREGEKTLFATPLETYEALLIKQGRGEALSPGETAFLPWFREKYQEMLELVGEDIHRRVQLALVP